VSRLKLAAAIARSIENIIGGDPMHRHRYLSSKIGLLVSIIWALPALGNGIDRAIYTGRFNNLDQNAGSYMEWTITFGDLAAPLGTQYAPIEFSFVIPELISFTWTASGDISHPANLAGTIESCGDPGCDGSVHSDNHYDNPFGISSQWYFVDVYYPGVHSFDFHFTDPPAGGTLVPMAFRLVENNFLRNGTPVGLPEGFSLIVDPDGAIRDVSVTGMTLSGSSADGVPEPTSCFLVALGLLGITAIANSLKTRM
jgi:hypothetical protein